MEQGGYFSVIIWILNIRCLVEILRDCGFYVQASIEEANCYFLVSVDSVEFSYELFV